jgi:hypothetical protein
MDVAWAFGSITVMLGMRQALTPNKTAINKKEVR